MNSDLQKLIELEKVDREIGRLSDEVAALPKRVALIEETLAGDKAKVEQAKAAIKNNEASRRKYEADIQTSQQKIVKYRSQSTSVKTNDEYRALMHEVEFAEKEISASEDKILELMVSLESEEISLKAAEIDLKAEVAAVEKEKNEARARTAEDEKLLQGLNQKRSELRVGVTDTNLAHYDRVLRARKFAIAEARDSKCQACFVMIRPQTWQELTTNEHIITCSSCGRILFYDPAHEPAIPPDAVPNPRKKKSKAAQSEAAQAEAPADAELEAEPAPESTPAQ